jgi:hypothetical protein
MKKMLIIKPLLLIFSFIIILSCNNNSATKEKEITDKKPGSEETKTISSATGDNTISFYLSGDEDLVSTKADVMLNEINGKQTLTVANISTDSKKHLV